MAIDPSIYGLLKPQEAPSMLDAMGKAQSLGMGQVQQAHMAQQMDTEKMQAHLQKASAFGNALEGLAGMPERERAAAYPKVYQQLAQAGIVSPDQAPAEYDSGFFRSSLMRYRQTAPAIENQLKQAQAAHLYAQAAKDRRESKEAKVLPSDKVLALSEGRQVPKLLSELQNTVEANKDTFGPYAGRVAALNPWNEKAKTIDAQVRTVRQTIGKLKEGGVLRKEDEEKYAKMLPELSDTPEIAMNKIALVGREMSIKLGDQISDLGKAGYDVSGFSSGSGEASPELPKILKGDRGRSGIVKTAQADERPAAPKHGTVVDGYVFMGGDPAQQKNWKKAR